MPRSRQGKSRKAESKDGGQPKISDENPKPSAKGSGLEKRILKVLKGTPKITTKKMFGGLCILHGGNMLCGITKDDSFMVRVGKDAYDSTLKLDHASKMTFTGREMRGMVYVDVKGIEKEKDLREWINRGLTFTNSLPVKKK
mmetsp:Transcript_4663/g.9750  ORF Transcript_4663/g.9750 Transcript_4663/m.9750 type:complete len:142 (-) Transcript_4663:151-576(-)